MVSAARPPRLERRGVLGVHDQQEKLALGLGVEEQCPGSDVGHVGDLLGGDLTDAMFGEQLAGCGDDARELGLLVALAPSDRLGGC